MPKKDSNKYAGHEGEKIGRLTLLRVAKNAKNMSGYICTCDCNSGIEFYKGNTYLFNRKHESEHSCGCSKSEVTALFNRLTKRTRQGLTSHPFFGRWSAMMNRCYNPKQPNYLSYGGRGISVCEDWHDAANYFLWLQSQIDEIQTAPKRIEVDRIDVNGPYSPKNCRLVNSSLNCSNKRTTKKLQLGGFVFTASQAAREFGMASCEVISTRLRRGWPHEKAILKPSTTILEEITNKFGLHMFFDGYQCSPESLSSIDKLSEFLDTFPAKIGMQKISQPYVFKYLNPNSPEEWGITGTIVLATSHISFHTFPEHSGFVTADVYSCTAFDPSLVLEVFQEFFNAKEFGLKLQIRGREGKHQFSSQQLARNIQPGIIWKDQAETVYKEAIRVSS